MASGMSLSGTDPEQGMLVDPDVVALAARIEAMGTSGTAGIGSPDDESDAIAECFWEVAFGACEHCGRAAVNRNDMVQHDLQLELANPSCDSFKSSATETPLAGTLGVYQGLATSVPTAGETPTARERLVAAGIPDWMVDEFDVAWDDSNGVVLGLQSLDFDLERWAPDGFAWTTFEDGGRVVQGAPLDDARSPEEWRIALGAEITLVSDNIAAVTDFVEEVLETMLMNTEAHTYEVASRRAAYAKGKLEEPQPITLLFESNESHSYAYSRYLRTGEYVTEIDGLARLQLVNGDTVPVIQPYVFEDDTFSDLESRESGGGSSEEEETAALTDEASADGDSDGGGTDQLAPEVDDDLEMQAQPDEPAGETTADVIYSHAANESYSPMKQ
ncbi:hypothetical protein BMF94_3505 [Rhodotorula taiwanensis]|uniref:Uncharacterized protein n=1 Tax=Rhodotorula taiwanensis TaxID=741276 RepID=A0A2S5B9X2_9BASI|nr:hypothetical protein BMF94_3505 [Rhodotorula taiwanensis]